MWVKLCGLTSQAAVAAALDLEVDALGFVFSVSVRRLSVVQALTLARPARGRARCVAVMRRPTQALVDQVLAGFGPDALQAELGDLRALHLPQTLELLPVVRDVDGVADGPPPARLLFEGALSGAGARSDWHAAAALARRSQLVLAGGLTPHNVGDAIEAVRPFGVDVSSGIEERPGVKSPAAMAEFVRAARAHRFTEETR